MKIGDLVKRHSSKHLGVVIDVLDRYAKVAWNEDYGTFWAPKRAVRVVSDNFDVIRSASENR